MLPQHRTKHQVLWHLISSSYQYGTILKVQKDKWQLNDISRAKIASEYSSVIWLNTSVFSKGQCNVLDWLGVMKWNWVKKIILTQNYHKTNTEQHNKTKQKRSNIIKHNFCNFALVLKVHMFIQCVDWPCM